LRDRAEAASRESLDANFASFNGTIFLRANRPVGTGFRRLRQDLEGFLSAERKGSAGCSFRSRERTRRKENFSAWRKITFTAQRMNLIFRVAETILRKRDDFADIADDFTERGSGREFSFILFFSFLLSFFHSICSRLICVIFIFLISLKIVTLERSSLCHGTN